jgi:hypothetical protein
VHVCRHTLLAPRSIPLGFHFWGSKADGPGCQVEAGRPVVAGTAIPPPSAHNNHYTNPLSLYLRPPPLNLHAFPQPLRSPIRPTITPLDPPLFPRWVAPSHPQIRAPGIHPHKDATSDPKPGPQTCNLGPQTCNLGGVQRCDLGCGFCSLVV